MAETIAAIDVVVSPTAVVVDVAGVGVQGPPGAPGPAGPPGPQGPAGEGATGDIAVDSVALTETIAPPVPAADTATIWLQDNGSGQSQLMVQFATGAAVQLAIQPAGPVLPFGGVVSAANLVSYWTLDEASGTRVDSHGTNHLAPTNAPVGAAGKIGNGCDFESSSSQYLSHADPSPLGDEDFTYSLWFKLEVTNLRMQFLAKDAAATRSYFIEYDNVQRPSLAFGTGSLVVLGPVVADTNWHFLIVWHDAAANTINLQLDNGAVASTATGGAFPAPLTNAVRIGAREYATVEDYFDGLIDEVGLWRRVLTAQERTDLYNGGAGLAY